MDSKNFCQLHSPSDFLTNICGGKEAWKLTKKNIFTDIFHGFEPPWNPMKWLELPYKYWGDNLAPRVLFFCYIQTLCYFMSSTLHKIDVFLVYKLQKIFLQFWKTEKSWFFSSITAPILSKICSSLNLRTFCKVANSYLLLMMLFI